MVLNLLSEILAGLIIGGIISYTGFKIWKKQFFYQKRLEVYAEFLPYLFKLRTYIEREFEKKNSTVLKNMIQEEIEYHTIPLAQKIGVYFNESYLNDILDLIGLYNKINSELNDLSKEEMQNFIDQRFIRIYFIRKKVILENDRLPDDDDSEEIKKLVRLYKKKIRQNI